MTQSSNANALPGNSSETRSSVNSLKSFLHPSLSNGNNSSSVTPSLTPKTQSKFLLNTLNQTPDVLRKMNGNETDKEFGMTPEMISKLSHEELVSQLLKAQAKIHALEHTKTDHHESKHAHFSSDSSVDQNIECNLNRKSSHNNRQLKSMLQTYEGDGPQSLRRAHKADELLIAYEHKGEFPKCDEDLSISMSEDLHAKKSEYSKQILHYDAWNYETDSDYDDIEEFPLIPSPVLNTPPYEYIFLTKENEAKFRIFLNPKLNEVFQEELAKLRTLEDRSQPLQRKSFQNSTHHCINHNQNHMDYHNQNHIINSSPSEVDGYFGNTLSASNVIHCFDPSDVDLELKKIFTEKPPLTHKIVRRRSRKERGSSVPAIDSYYGTQDINKVGHASYFIPTLTESERKAIGWKPEYHYGHWKYANLTVPNVRTNPIPLHPHPHPEEEENRSMSKHHSHHHPYHNHHHHHSYPDRLLSQNPLHQKEINLLDDTFLIGSEAQSLLDSPSPADHRPHTQHSRCPNCTNEPEDPLSFITLSGSPSDPSSASCHLIPDKCTLRRILRWILPACMRTPESSDAGSFLSTSYCSTCDGSNTTRTSANTNQSDKTEKKSHEIETLVEPSSKLTFPASEPNISFTSMESREKNAYNNNNHQVAAAVKNVNISGEKEQYRDHDHSHHQHHNHSRSHSHHHHHNHHHSHHHGLFHWKYILSHGTTIKDGTESMSVVGGDVVESGNASTTDGSVQLLDVIHIDVQSQASCDENTKVVIDNVPLKNQEKALDYLNSTDSDDEQGFEGTAKKEDVGGKRNGKKLKASKAFTKILTLKDLGYETDSSEDSDHYHANIEESVEETERINFNTSTSKKQESSTEAANEKAYQDLIAKKRRRKKVRSQKREESQKHAGLGFLKAQTMSISLEEKGHVGRKESSSDNTGNEGDDDFSSCGSGGFLFSSMSVSYQDSAGTSQLSDSLLGSGQFGLFCKPSENKRQSHTETRFLDPKDLLTPRYQQHMKIENQQTVDVLPFVYDLGDTSNSNNHVVGAANEYFVDDQDSVIEWIDHNFVDEIEEGLGLLNSCLEVILNQKRMQNDNENDSNQDFMNNQHIPDKVEGQHRIFTLNDLEKQVDIENLNQNL